MVFAFEALKTKIEGNFSENGKKTVENGKKRQDAGIAVAGTLRKSVFSTSI